jgi:3-hydroxyisobutyrate dehydrogenase-like beta-hydroxyacid dehydrogenase
LRDVIMSSSGAGPAVLAVARFYDARHQSGHSPQAAIRIVIKDLELAIELGDEVGLPVRTASAALDAWREAADAGLADSEWWTLIDHMEAIGRP